MEFANEEVLFVSEEVLYYQKEEDVFFCKNK